MHHHPLLYHEDEEEEEEDMETLERTLQERYGNKDVEYDEEPTEIEQQSLLPSNRDPKLWRVTCASGHEREVAVCLMQKYIDKGSGLKIRSVIALDHLKNFIYVEADKIAHVREEMTDVLSVKTKAVHLSKGVWVRMKIGLYKGELAKVVGVDDVQKKVTVKLFPRIDLRALANKQENLVMSDKELCKYFEPGNQVKIVSGAAEGTTGFVVSLDGPVVNILSDTTKELLPVFADNVVEISGETTGLTRIGDYELHDLVQLANMSFGVIIHMENGSFQVLKGVPGKPLVAVVRPGEIRCKLDGNKSRTKDQLDRLLSVNDHVQVVEGQWRGKTGRIAHICKGNLFIYDHCHLEHAGFICAKSQSCILVGGLQATNYSKGEDTSSCSDAHLSQHRSSRDCSSMNSEGRCRAGWRYDALIGAFIKIRGGVYKGHKGRVKEIKGKTVWVELKAQMRVVPVSFDQITDIVNVSIPSRETARSGLGSDASVHNSQTPLDPCMTPMRDQ